MTYELLIGEDVVILNVEDEAEARRFAINLAHAKDELVILLGDGIWIDAFYGPTMNNAMYYETLGEMT